MQWEARSKAWTAVDLGVRAQGCAVSVRAATRGALPQVTAAAEHGPALPAADGEATGANPLRELMGRVDRSLPALVTLPREHYRLRTMAEPAVPVRELENSLRWALAAEADAMMDDFHLAWLRIPQAGAAPGRVRQVYTVQTARTWLAERLTAWKQLGLRPKVVDIRETALRNIAGALERPGETVALLSVDAQGVAIVFTRGGSLLLDRFIELPLSELRSADGPTRAQVHERIAVQLMRSVDVVARAFPAAPVTRLLLAPMPEPIGLAEYLQTQLPLQVERVDLSRVFDLSRVPALRKDEALQARCLVALGATLRDGVAADGAGAA